MRPLTAFNIAVGVVAAIAFASIAPPAWADENPYHPAPIAVTETADHGQALYCTKPILGTCSLGDVRNGGPGNTDNNAATLTPDTPHAPPSPPCGPKV